MELLPPCSTSQRPTYHTKLGSSSPNSSNPCRRLEANFPGCLELQDQNPGGGEGVWIECSGAGRPLVGMLFRSYAPKWGANRGLGNPVLGQGMESYSPNLPEPPSGQRGTQSVPSLTHSPLPTQPGGRIVHAAEPPAGGATGPAAAGCCLMERGSVDISGNLLGLTSSGQSAPLG